MTQGFEVPMSDSELAALIQRAEEDGISRRQLLKLFASGGVGAVRVFAERGSTVAILVGP